MDKWLPPIIFLVASLGFGRGVFAALTSRTVHEAGLLADREIQPGRAQLIIAMKFVWLGLSLAALIVSTIAALKQD